MTFVLATHNQGKVVEMAKMLGEFGLEVKSAADLGITMDVEENGESFAENALIKAKAICELSGLPAIADDSGICVDALNGGPGIYSARYGGEGLDDIGRNRLLLSSLQGETNRACHYIASIACCFPNGDVVTAEGRVDGNVAFAMIGTNGFGYDSLFFYPPYAKTFGQTDPADKDKVSHRGRALKEFCVKLEEYLKNHQE